MTTPDPRLSRRDADRLLDAPTEHGGALGSALDAAAAPGSPRELRREEATLEAFRAARLAAAPAAGPVSSDPRRRAASRAVVATGAVVALVSGSLALADVADVPLLPGLSDRASEPASESTSQSGSTSGSTPGSTSGSAPGSASASDPASTSAPTSPSTSQPEQSGPGSAGATSGPSSHDASPSSSPDASPSSPAPTSLPTTAPSSAPTSSAPTSTAPAAELRGLCRAYLAGDRGAGGSLDSSAFRTLATAAGGVDKIADYCIALIGPPDTTDGSADSDPGPAEPDRAGEPDRVSESTGPGSPVRSDGPGKPDTPGKP